MIDLELLQKRVTRIPEMISERRLRDSFAKFTKDLQVSEAQLSSARNDAIHVNLVFPQAGCVKQVEQKATLVLNKLSRVQTLVAKDSFKIKSRTVDNSIAEIRSLSAKASTIPQTSWLDQKETVVEKYRAIVTVIQKLRTKESKNLTDSIRIIESAKLPQNPEDCQQIRTSIEEFKSNISRQGLEGKFGKFLVSSATDEGAKLDEMKDPEVQAGFDSFDLWGSFRVKLYE